jgi:hypothetical protein
MFCVCVFLRGQRYQKDRHFKIGGANFHENWPCNVPRACHQTERRQGKSIFDAPAIGYLQALSWQTFAGPIFLLFCL